MYWIVVLSLLAACTPSRDMTLTHSLALQRQQETALLTASPSLPRLELALGTMEQSLSRIEQSLWRLEYAIAHPRCR